jgi:hypothetical protein
MSSKFVTLYSLYLQGNEDAVAISASKKLNTGKDHYKSGEWRFDHSF